MASTKKILTSLHGKRIGIAHDGKLVVEGRTAVTQDDAGIQLGIQGAPTAKTTAATLTIAELRTGLLTGTHAAGATVAYTLPTGTLADAGFTDPALAIGEAFDWVLINLSAAALDTITVTAGTAHTIVGNPIVQSSHATTGGIYGNSSQWRTRKTAASTFVTYRTA